MFTVAVKLHFCSYYPVKDIGFVLIVDFKALKSILRAFYPLTLPSIKALIVKLTEVNFTMPNYPTTSLPDSQIVHKLKF